ncbi:MAG: DNA (cytosine-5-)-methyltransferase [Bacilli bacterium]
MFAGVGGFRIGLNHVTLTENKVHEQNNWDFVFTNQWEPSTKIQPAYECYKHRFGVNKDKYLASLENISISNVPEDAIPNHDLLVAGFPCQDYSVARSLKNESGIEGKKGVLWWDINRIIKSKRPSYIILENVDRLLKSPSKQRGRDFAIILKSLCDFGYDVEWRVVNAAEYGFPQRRRRVFIFAYFKESKYFIKMKKYSEYELLSSKGLFQKVFPTKKFEESMISSINLDDIFSNIVEISNKFEFKFENSGMIRNNNIITVKSCPISVKSINLGNILEKNVSEKYYLSEQQIAKFEILRNGKKISRTRPDGTSYIYSEGSMSKYDSLDLPARTMLTSEGSVNRSSHIILDPKSNRLRFLTPVEAERINMFPDNWTNIALMSNRKRMFTMGNALVTGIVGLIGDELLNYI